MRRYYNFTFAEKYKDKFDAAQASLAQQVEPTRSLTRFIEEDINDTDLGSLLEAILQEPSSSRAKKQTVHRPLGPTDSHSDPSSSSNPASGPPPDERSVSRQGTPIESASDESVTSVVQSDSQACGEALGGRESESTSSGGREVLVHSTPDGASLEGSVDVGDGSGERAFDSLLIFCNNVAFNQGTIHRYCCPSPTPPILFHPPLAT